MADRFALRCVVLGFAAALAGCESPLRSGLDERQADQVLASLRQEGVSARRERAADGTWSLVASERDPQDAERVMHRYELPRDEHPRVPELFPGTGLMPSEREEHLRYQYAIGQELAATIERIDGVLSASVQVSIPNEDKRGRESPPPSASVFVRYRSDQRVDLMKAQLRTMVAHALPGATVENVAVFTLPVAPALTDRETDRLGSALSAAHRPGAWPAFVTLLPWLLLVGLASFWITRPSRRERLLGSIASFRARFDRAHRRRGSTRPNRKAP
ncbi:type III secretion system inner membrane ring lipoprotein SctJ [Luteibacter sp. CQ10]|uniref:type III secretion system inner membrane ring lipoprotein SctJ n=1 Tax=Luteibacter sp. CQ10 TaxID=2805821 RepID=UPI0034A5A3BD